ncbi:PRMT5-domain-containing protein [Obba rivulosa]|uniref:Protein arginine N-methyltransferase n=1 Tax=Obba rivulosa TaxID=1052685 RepID=A0A8E2J4H6_9APHY|nr:PRMT5-domain-containing protein [Obba rivulosa]
MPTFTSHVSLDDITRLASHTGLSPKSTPILQAAEEARANDYDAICYPLTTEKWRKRWQDMCLFPGEDVEDKNALEQRAEAWRAKPTFSLDEVTVTRLDEAEGTVALISDWLELDASDDWVRHDAEIALQQELAYASYLNFHTAILPPPRNREHVASYARAVNACLHAVPFIELSVRISIYDPSVFHASSAAKRASVLEPSSPGSSPAQAPVSAWEIWDTIHSICDYNLRLTLTLDLTLPLPSTLGLLSQWLAEPIRHIFLPASAFIANAKGYPVLPKGTQAFIRDVMKLQPNIILSGTSAGRHSRGGESAYKQYVRHLEKTSPSVQAAQTRGTVEHFARGYQDYLQAPLQPLMDNLQSATYETFERDPVKYNNYEQAIYLALAEWPRPGKILLCVAGAGRGPLVARCLSAIERSGKDAFVYAVEKNPNAFVTLQERKKLEWKEKVELLYGDMRTLVVPEKVDILVSELLGSFGDNELSPECLDGAMRFLKPDGISIPASYTAHIAPLSSSKLYNDTGSTADQKAAETPYVVKFNAINILSGDGGGVSGTCGPKIQECWEFEHPRSDAVLDRRGLPLTNSHNARSARLTFHIPHEGVLHGLAGYFEARLYGSVGLSIHPNTMDKVSKDMLSWFPLFFPLRDPLYLPSNSELHVSIWRLTNQRQVWYEWHAEAFLPVPRSAPNSDRTPNVTKRKRQSQDTVLLSPRPLSAVASSPLVDAVDVPFIVERGERTAEEEEDRGEVMLVKIGQTALHNPHGRSSWIGL